MSEYWKSTPKYWCKSCSMYVRDTKLERSNHEATGKHQGAIKRQLRDLHRAHEQGEREKERAKREVERLNGVVSGRPSLSGRTNTAGVPTPASRQATQAERQRQLEQLADLGVSIPTELRPDMAMVGDWTVTATRVIEETSLDKQGKEIKDSKPSSTAAVAIGMKRDRERTEDEKDAAELEKAYDNLRKKPKKWGRGEEQDEDLDALLDESLAVPKREVGDVHEVKAEDEAHVEEKPPVKSEASEGGLGTPPKTETCDPVSNDKMAIQTPSIMFKKRKPKGSRQV